MIKEMIKEIRILIIALIVAMAVACNTNVVHNKQTIKTEKILETTTSWDGTTLPPYPTDQPKISILKISIPPAAKLPIHYHSIINCAVVIKGTLKVVKEDGQEIIISEGQAISEVINKYHYGINETDKEVELIVFYAGDKTFPLSIKK